MVLQFGFHLVDAVCVLGLIVGQVLHPAIELVVAVAVVVVGCFSFLQALGPKWKKPCKPFPVDI